MDSRTTRVIEFERQIAGVACTAEARAKVTETPRPGERRELKARAKRR